MARNCYISDDLIKLLEDIKEFGNFSSKKAASKSLARSLNQMPLSTLISKDRSEFDYIGLGD